MNALTRISLIVFFASHIPITMMVDGQAILPESGEWLGVVSFGREMILTHFLNLLYSLPYPVEKPVWLVHRNLQRHADG